MDPKQAKTKQARLTEWLEALDATPAQPVTCSQLREAMQLTIELENLHFQVLGNMR